MPRSARDPTRSLRRGGAPEAADTMDREIKPEGQELVPHSEVMLSELIGTRSDLAARFGRLVARC